MKGKPLLLYYLIRKVFAELFSKSDKNEGIYYRK